MMSISRIDKCLILNRLTPLSAVVAPGSLTIKSLPFTENTTHDIGHKLSFDTPVYATASGGGSGDENGMRGSFGLHASKSLSTIALTVGVTSKILTVTPDSSNETYTWSFIGPALKCGVTIPKDLYRSPDTYIAWTGNDYPWNDPLYRQNAYRFAPLDIDDIKGLNETEGNVIRILVPDRLNAVPRITECRLWNATYDAEFSYQNFEQTIIVHQIIYHNPVWMTPSDVLLYRERATPSHIVTLISYKAIMSAFGSLVVGTYQAYVQFSLQQDGVIPLTMPQYPLLDCAEIAYHEKSAEQLFQNITLSLFSNPIFVYVLYVKAYV